MIADQTWLLVFKLRLWQQTKVVFGFRPGKEVFSAALLVDVKCTSGKCKEKLGIASFLLYGRFLNSKPLKSKPQDLKQ